jgi:purine nucleosidase
VTRQWRGVSLAATAPSRMLRTSGESAHRLGDRIEGAAVKQRVIVDADVGIDDALALLYLAAHDDIEIVAVGSVHGNIDSRRAALNAIRVLGLCGHEDVPVAQGASSPLNQPLHVSWRVHGADGLGNLGNQPSTRDITGETAAEQLVRLSAESPGELDLLAIGPLTNLALAYREDPEVFGRLRSVVIMGGSGCETDRQDEASRDLTVDANTDHDPEAADLVYSVAGNIVMVGADLEPYLILDEDRMALLGHAEAPHSDFVWRMLQFYIDFYESKTGRRIAALWDPLAAAVLRDPSLILTSTERPVDVVPTSMGFRALGLSDRRSDGRFDGRPPVQVVTSVDSHRMLDDFVDRLTKPIGA